MPPSYACNFSRAFSNKFATTNHVGASRQVFPSAVLVPTISSGQRLHQSYWNSSQNFLVRPDSSKLAPRNIESASWIYPKRQLASTHSSISVTSFIIVGVCFAILAVTEKPPQFEYPAVDHKTGIRLLILQPGKRGSRIKCKLVSTTFGDNPTYDALSYAWGDATPNRAMGLNGSEILVTDTLWDALASLRDERAPKAVWVDFLCINQKDEDEKSRQVPLMAFIYQRAQQVVVWLGSHQEPVDEELKQKLGFAKRVDKKAERAAIKYEYFLYALIQEEYWKRAWIIQELGMASKIKICYRSGSMEWQEFIKQLSWYREQNPDDAATERILKLDNMRRSKFTQTTKFSIRSLVDDFRDAFCKRPHDKIYAFFGLANDTVDKKLPIDYKKTISEVYYDVMRHHFETLQFETQEMSSIEALYFAALFRRLLTREQVQQRKTIKTFKDTITKDPKTNYIAPTPDTSPEDTSKTQILNKKGDEPYSSEFAHMSYHNMGHHYSYDNFYPVRGSDAKKRKKEKKNDSDENDDSEEKENRKKDELWKKALLVGTGIVITAGVSWLLWNVLCQKPPDNLTWCWKESSAEDISTWAATAAEEPKEFTLRGAIIGKVEHLGPSTSSLTTSYEAVRQWNAKLVNYVHTSENLAIVRGLNGKLLSILSNTADFRNRNAVSFNPYQPPTSLYAQNFKSTSPSQKGSKEPTVLFIGTNMTLGIAPGDTREGDLICQFWNSNACAVLRRTGFGFQPRYKIVGRAAVVSRDESVDWEVPADKERFIKTGLFRSGIVDLPVSIGMITRLSLDTVNLPSTS